MTGVSTGDHSGRHVRRLAATIGTGNITGVAAAVIAGGPGAVILDVGLRVPWNGDSLRGDSPGDPVPGKRSGRRLDRGADDVSGKTAGMFMGGSSVRIVLHSGGIRDGQHGAGQRDRGDRILCVRDPGGGGGRDRCDSRRECAGGRRKADLSRGGAACPIVRPGSTRRQRWR